MRSAYYKPQNGTNCKYAKLKGEFFVNISFPLFLKLIVVSLAL